MINGNQIAKLKCNTCDTNIQEFLSTYRADPWQILRTINFFPHYLLGPNLSVFYAKN